MIEFKVVRFKVVRFKVVRQCQHRQPYTKGPGATGPGQPKKNRNGSVAILPKAGTNCAPLPEAEAETRWRGTQTIEAVMPAHWTRALLEQFVEDLCAQAGITDLTLVTFQGEPDPLPGTYQSRGDLRVERRGLVTVNGNGHALSMALTFVPDKILGPWLLSHREDGNIWSAVYRPQPRDAQGTVLAPLVSGGAR